MGAAADVVHPALPDGQRARTRNAGDRRPRGRSRGPGCRADQPAGGAAVVLRPVRAAGRDRLGRRDERRRRPRALSLLSRARLRASRAQLERAGLAMPTARELLEQADALMRRNRAAAADAAKPAPIPPLAGGTIASPA